MLYTMKDKKDNKVYTLKGMDKVMLKDDKDLFVVRLDGSKLHTYDEFEKTAKAAFQTPTDDFINDTLPDVENIEDSQEYTMALNPQAMRENKTKNQEVFKL